MRRVFEDGFWGMITDVVVIAVVGLGLSIMYVCVVVL